jgi:hypothetical protein
MKSNASGAPRSRDHEWAGVITLRFRGLQGLLGSGLARPLGSGLTDEGFPVSRLRGRPAQVRRPPPAVCGRHNA